MNKPTVQNTARYPALAEWLALAALLLVNFALLKKAMLYGFDPEDYGGFLNTAWRITMGQRLYVDFHFHAVPLYVDTLALLFKILGFGKAAILTLLVVTSSLATLVVYAAAKKWIPWPFAFLAALMTACGFNWFYAFPTYDTYVSFWGIVGTCLLLARMPFTSREAAFWTGFATGFLALSAVLTKLNDGLLFGFVFLVFFLVNREFRAWGFFGYAAGCWATALLGLHLIGDIPAFLVNNFDYYNNNMGSRFQRMTSPGEWLNHGYWLPLLAGTWLARRSLWKLREFYVLLAGVAMTAIFSHITGSHRHPGHMPLLGMIVALGFCVIFQSDAAEGGRKSPLFKAGAALLSFLVLFQTARCVGYACESISGRKTHSIYGRCCDYTMQEGPLQGWHVYEIWGRNLEAIAPYVRDHIPQKDSFLVLTNLHVLYALTGRVPYPGVSFQFKFQDQPQPGKQQEAVSHNIQNNPPDWILTYKDNGPFKLNIMLVYLGLEEFLFSHYQPVQSWGPYILFKRK
ncbi:MAG TPA: hypothetical protein VL688_12360 [Verrucomicrobiae bacterium]|jgi:hypothetical protein|nr:hypothetical protein [Verrucomicrobiae bacterium]